MRLSEDRPKGWLSGLFASHQPSAERVENDKKTPISSVPKPTDAAYHEGRKTLPYP